MNDSNNSKLIFFGGISQKSLHTQLAKIREELDEVSMEVIKFRNQEDYDKAILLEELFDLGQATFTLINSMFSADEIKAGNNKHLEKMIKRWEGGAKDGR